MLETNPHVPRATLERAQNPPSARLAPSRAAKHPVEGAQKELNKTSPNRARIALRAPGARGKLVANHGHSDNEIAHAEERIE